MSHPLVSILMPAHFSQSFIARSIESVRAQTYPNWELLIIADDGQDYAPVLKEAGINDKRIHITTSDGITTGPAHARNKGLDAARGELIATLDSDDVFHPVRLEVLVPEAVKHGYAFSMMEVRRDRGHGIVQSLFLPDYPLPSVLRVTDHLPLSFFSTGGVYDRRRVPLRWQEDLPVNEDAVFAMQAYDHVETTFCAPVPVYSYLRRNDSYSMDEKFFEQAVRVKESLLASLRAGTLPLKKPETKRAFETFMEVSLEVEKEMAKQRHSEADFVALLQERWKPNSNQTTQRVSSAHGGD